MRFSSGAFRTKALLVCALAGLLAACGQQQVATLPQIQIDPATLSFQATPAETASALQLSYTLDNQATQSASFDSSGKALIKGACPGPNTINYQFSANGLTSPQVNQTFDYSASSPFAVTLPSNDTFVVGSKTTVQFVLASTVQFGCTPVVTQDVSGVVSAGDPVLSQDQGKYVIAVPVTATSSGDGLIRLNVALGNTVQHMNFPVHFTAADPTAVVSAVAISGDSTVSLNASETYQVKASVNGTGNFNTALAYTSDHPEIASVNSDGLVTANTTGKAVVTAQSVGDSSKTATLGITVAQPDMQLQSDVGTQTIVQGNSGQFQLSLTSKNQYQSAAKLQFVAPPGMTVTSDSDALDIGGSAKVLVKVSSSVAPDTYAIGVTASDQKNVAQPAQISLKVTVNAAPVTPTPTPTPSPTPAPTPTPIPTPSGPPDSVVPTLGTPNLPSDGLINAPVTIQVSASDNVAVKSVTLAIDGSVVKTFTAAGSQYSLAFDPTGMRVGAHAMQIMATDTSSNTTVWNGTIDYRPDGSLLHFVHRLPLGTGIASSNMVLDRASQNLFVGVGYRLLKFDLGTLKETEVSYTDGTVKSLAYDAATNLVWTVTGSGAIRGVNPDDLSTQVGPLASGGNPTTAAVLVPGGVFLGTDHGLVSAGASGLKKITTNLVLGLASNGSTLYMSDSRSINAFSLGGTLITSVVNASKSTWLAAGANSVYSGWSSGYGGSVLNGQTLAAQDMVFASPLGGSLSTVSELNGAPWFTDHNGEIGFLGGRMLKLNSSIDYAPLSLGSTLYAVTVNGSLYRLTAQSGVMTQTGQADSLGSPFASVVVDASGTLYYPSLGGSIYVVTAK